MQPLSTGDVHLGMEVCVLLLVHILLDKASLQTGSRQLNVVVAVRSEINLQNPNVILKNMVPQKQLTVVRV